MPAARLGDDIAHTEAGLGMGLGILAGAVAGAVLVGATIATGGAALAVVAAVGGAAGLVSFGGLKGMHIGEAVMGPPCGKFVTGAPTVLVNDRPATFTFGSLAACAKESGAPIPLATGAATVMIMIGMAGREGEKIGCSALSVKQTSPNVIIGGPSAPDPRVPITPEVPAWAVTALEVLGIAGMVAALPFSVAALGVAATVGGLVMGTVGSIYGGKGMRALGEKLGLSEAQIRAMEAGGEFFGGLAGGAVGTKGAGALGNRFRPATVDPVVPPAGRFSPEVLADADRLRLPPEKVQEIIDTPKRDPAVPGSGRPPASSYVDAQRQAEHAAAFENGASRFTLKSSYEKYGLGQRDGTTFVSTPEDADAIAASAGGDPRKLEAALGLPPGQLDGDQLLRVDFTRDAMQDLNVRIPDGNEAGANEQWIPGGYLPGGQNEAVLDGVNALPHHFSIKGL